MLATYIGQAKALRDRLRSAGLIHERPADGDDAAHAQPSVRVSTVDNFQGEEADVIVLSLVRSNGGGGIGFLSIANRVCVALSRARHGFYILGNATCLRASRSPPGARPAYLEEQNALGRRLPCCRATTARARPTARRGRPRRADPRPERADRTRSTRGGSAPASLGALVASRTPRVRRDRGHEKVGPAPRRRADRPVAGPRAPGIAPRRAAWPGGSGDGPGVWPLGGSVGVGPAVCRRDGTSVWCAGVGMSVGVGACVCAAGVGGAECVGAAYGTAECVGAPDERARARAGVGARSSSTSG